MAIARGDALRRGADAIAVIGGTEIFEQTMPAADRLVLTRVHMIAARREHLSRRSIRNVWREIERSEQPKGEGDDCGFTYLTYIRSGAA